eukprot:3386530-Alexandrium_andersonii.AAC.1
MFWALACANSHGLPDCGLEDCRLELATSRCCDCGPLSPRRRVQIRKLPNLTQNAPLGSFGEQLRGRVRGRAVQVSIA